MREYRHKELRERERLGYSRISAGRQCCYIIKQAAAEKLRDFRSRFKLWTTRGKSCKRCCLRCKYSAIAAPILITIRSKSYERQYFTRY